jgi:prophage antirepressor-like protein|nr:MAG TPA: repressor domain protein [Bacteriophage sp.]
MNDLMIFEGHEVEVLEVKGQVLFNPKHVAECLEIADVNSSIRNFNEKQVVKLTNSDVHNLHIRKLNNAGENFLTESGVYKLVFKSHKPNAEAFTDWIADEVLPAIRKTGGYINNADLLVNTYFDDIPEDQKAIVKGLLQNIESKQKKITALDKENDLLAERALQWADRPLINALVRAYGRSLGGDYSTAWGDFKKELLYRHGINLNARITHYLNNTGKKTKPRTLDMLDDSELQKALSTAAALCRENNVDISDIIDKKAS